MTTRHAHGDALAGHLLGDRYRLEFLIGRGGMASVYRATDERLDRSVAVKLFGGASDDDANSQRAATEVRLLAALNHPSLVTLYDAHVVPDEDAFLVMELVDGPTLRDRLVDNPIDRVDIAAMALDLAEALHAVHDAGMVHRDVKPSNVLLAPSLSPTREFRAKLADFGIAHLVDSARLTAPGTIMGTAAYLSPEQTRGIAPVPAGDVYSLGLVLLESFTRMRAFPGSMTESLVARVQRDPVVPGELGYEWKSLLTAMIARAPGERPSALEVASAAGSILRAEGTGPLVSSEAESLGRTMTLSASDDGTARLETVSSTRLTGPSPAADATVPVVPASPSEDDTDPAPILRGDRPRRSTKPPSPRTSDSRRRRRLVVAALFVAVGIGTAAAATSWLADDRAGTARTDGEPTALTSLSTSIDGVSAGVQALITAGTSAPAEGAETDSVPATDTNGPDATDPVTEAPAPGGGATDPAPGAPPPDGTVPDPAAPDPGGPGNGNGNGNENGKGPGNGKGPSN